MHQTFQPRTLLRFASKLGETTGCCLFSAACGQSDRCLEFETLSYVIPTCSVNGWEMFQNHIKILCNEFNIFLPVDAVFVAGHDHRHCYRQIILQLFKLQSQVT